MITSSVFTLCIFFGISSVFGFIFSYIFFKITVLKGVKQYKSDCLTYKKALSDIRTDLKNESILRYEIEKKLHIKLAESEERLKLLDYYQKRHNDLCDELKIQLNVNHETELKLKELKIRFEEYKISTEAKEKLFVDSENRLTIQFENLSNRILDQNRNKISEQNSLVLDGILNSFREQLNIFTNQIQKSFSKEERIKHDLTYEIHNLNRLNAQITQEAINLTRALKGNNKIQGNWGELILIKALEASGMREGHEFDFQLNMEKELNGSKSQPDVIVHLPHGKDVIIDSKVSLIAYERYFNSDNEQKKIIAINDHIHSLRTHIKLLNKKNYQDLFKINTLDYILMFVPIESAFILAIQKESSLLTDAMNRNVMLVSPTTLLIALKTIYNLWCYEYQNCHAKKIAEKAGRLYDKLRLFTEDLNKIGFYLNKAEHIYNSAKNKFSEGKGNIISQAEGFRTLGVQIKQPINLKNANNKSDSSVELLKEGVNNVSV